jgi:hypothetical protein
MVSTLMQEVPSGLMEEVLAATVEVLTDLMEEVLFATVEDLSSGAKSCIGLLMPGLGAGLLAGIM